MEHLPLWPGEQWTEDDYVPCVASEDYIGVPFLSYLEPYLPLGLYHESEELDVQTLDKIFQTCFFFSLLQEILGPRYSHQSYVAQLTDSATKFRVTTLHLEDDLRAWAEDVRSEDATARALRYEHLGACFTSLWLIFPVSAGRIPHKSRLCINALFITFQQAAFDAFGKYCLEVPSCRIPWPDDRDLRLMVEQGNWCPFEALKAWRSFTSITAVMLLRSMKRHQSDQRHTHCTEDHCEIAFVKKEDFVLAHATEDCSCSETYSVSDNAMLLDMLKRGDTPVLKLRASRASDHINVELVPAEQSKGYIAISHVWSDGLGNPLANAIRICQLEALARKIFALKAFVTDDAEDDTIEVQVWLDTICVPLEPESEKIIALQRMVDYYKNADCVLVIDREIKAHSYQESQHMLAGMVIFSSRWTWRLWTLQEAVMASKLYFAFANTFVERSTFCSGPTFQRCLRAASYSSCIIFAEFSWKARNLSMRPGGRYHPRDPYIVKTLHDSVQQRLVSVPSDEALCLANIVGFDVAIPEKNEGDRMALFWKKMCDKGSLDQQIIFNLFPRLNLSGYRWAPATLLDHNSPRSLHHELYFEWEPSTIAASTDEGIPVSFPGLTCCVSNSCLTSKQIITDEAQSAMVGRYCRDLATLQWTYFLWPDGVTTYFDEMADETSCSFILEDSTSDIARAVLVTASADSAEHFQTIVVGVFWRCTTDESNLLNLLEGSSTFPGKDSGQNETASRLWRMGRKDKTSPFESWMQNLYNVLRRGLFFDVIDRHSETRRWIVG